MGIKKDHAIGLYMEGIQEGRVKEAIEKYSGARYTQHSTGVPDGKAGFIECLGAFVERNTEREFEVVRALEDGQHVFVQVYQRLNGGAAEWSTMDFFDTDDNDKIIEHWDVIEAFAAKTPSGRSSIDGPRDIVDLDRTDDNRQLVRDLFERALVPGRTDELEKLVAEDLHQHDAALADGRAAYAAHVTGDGRRVRYDELFLLVVEGNFGATLCRTYLDDVETAQIDLYRIDAGKIVERWTVSEPVPPREEWTNGGKF